jgi:hypothetical protein
MDWPVFMPALQVGRGMRPVLDEFLQNACPGSFGLLQEL